MLASRHPCSPWTCAHCHDPNRTRCASCACRWENPLAASRNPHSPSANACERLANRRDRLANRRDRFANPFDRFANPCDRLPTSALPWCKPRAAVVNAREDGWNPRVASAKASVRLSMPRAASWKAHSAWTKACAAWGKRAAGWLIVRAGTIGAAGYRSQSRVARRYARSAFPGCLPQAPRR